MMDLGTRISKLPTQPDDPMMGWGFVFAIDTLREIEPAICALIRVVRDMTVRPTYGEVFDIVSRSLAMRDDLEELLAQRRRDGIGLQERARGRRVNRSVSIPAQVSVRKSKSPPLRTNGPIGFTRGN